MIYSNRHRPTVADDLECLQARCATLADTSYGLSIIFAALALVSALGGVWLRQPLLATSSGFALVASAAFAFWGHFIARAGARGQHLRVARVPRENNRRQG